MSQKYTRISLLSFSAVTNNLRAYRERGRNEEESQKADNPSRRDTSRRRRRRRRRRSHNCLLASEVPSLGYQLLTHSRTGAPAARRNAFSQCERARDAATRASDRVANLTVR